ncbi:DUF2871 domain-containing protein [Pseudonocardia sp. GCM10023141]|uniref:DUF2871 domain-containing protein n=1 Tax=Pseudonocardia sp. GCM10023141 TaxID=3252653 RepID=UPI00361D01A8
MKQLYYAALIYLVLGLAGGLGYREITKANGFTGDTQLAVVHTHLLVLGMLVFLVVLLLEKTFTLTDSRLFPWFFWVYNAGVVWTAAFLAINGTRTVAGEPTGAALAGMAGFGHILLTAGLVLFFVCLRSRLSTSDTAPTTTIGR